MNTTEPDYTTERGVWLPACLDRQHVTGTTDVHDANTYAGTTDAPESRVGAPAGTVEASQ